MKRATPAGGEILHCVQDDKVEALEKESTVRNAL